MRFVVLKAEFCADFFLQGFQGFAIVEIWDCVQVHHPMMPGKLPGEDAGPARSADWRSHEGIVKDGTILEELLRGWQILHGIPALVIGDDQDHVRRRNWHSTALQFFKSHVTILLNNVPIKWYDY